MDFKFVINILMLTKALQKFSSSKPNPFNHVFKEFKLGNKEYKYYSLPDLKDPRVGIKYK